MTQRGAMGGPPVPFSSARRDDLLAAGEYVPWPWRYPSDPIPAYCPKCGRKAVLRSWGGEHYYREMTCWGAFPWFWWFMYKTGWPSAGHWIFTIAEGYKSPTEGPFDPATGNFR